MSIVPKLSPVGKVVDVPGLNDLVEKMKGVWADAKKEFVTVQMPHVTQFLTQCADDLIVYLVEHDIPGADKKATVISVIDKLYDVAITGALPFYLRPFSGWVKNYVVNAQISHLIDWIVAKYNSGNWAPQASVTILAKYNL